MIYPKIQTKKEKSFTTDSFSQGIDLLAENAAIKNSCNLIYNDGVLTTRGGLTVPSKNSIYDASDFCIDEPYFCDTPILYDGKKYRLLYFKNDDEMSYVIYSFFLLDENSAARKIASLTFSRASSEMFNHPQSLFVFSAAPKNGCGIYAFASMFHETTLDEVYEDSLRIYELNSTMTKWTMVEEKDMYIPDYYINGRGLEYKQSEIDTPTPAFKEALNMLTPYFRCRFTADSVSTVFKLPIDKINNEYLKLFKCELLLSDGRVLSWSIGKNATVSNEVTYDGKATTVSFNATTGIFSFNNIVPTGHNGVSNNIVVTLSITNLENTKKISGMSNGIWYSSHRSGAHLCVSGNASYPSLLCVSGDNEPFYFPDNNCYYVGEPSQKITAMARQNKALVLFKEREIYCADYTSDKFSITHLHSNIGCDLPATVALCENRLVWACSDKKVYTLNALSDYGAVAVYGMSRKIDALLKNEEFNSAIACYLNKKYYLLLNKKIYVLDLSGALLQSNREFVSAASWFKWELPDETNIKYIYSGTDAANVVGTFDKTRYYIGNLSGINGADEVLYSANNTVASVEKLIKGEFTTGVMTDNNFFTNKMFLKTFFNMFATNNVSVAFFGNTGDTLKNSLINIKYNPNKAVTPHRVLPLIRAPGVAVQLKTSGSFKLNSITHFYRETV